MMTLADLLTTIAARVDALPRVDGGDGKPPSVCARAEVWRYPEGNLSVRWSAWCNRAGLDQLYEGRTAEAVLAAMDARIAECFPPHPVVLPEVGALSAGVTP